MKAKKESLNLTLQDDVVSPYWWDNTPLPSVIRWKGVVMKRWKCRQTGLITNRTVAVSRHLSYGRQFSVTTQWRLHQKLSKERPKRRSAGSRVYRAQVGVQGEAPEAEIQRLKLMIICSCKLQEKFESLVSITLSATSIFTALHGMQTPSSDENSVCLSNAW